jgi:hypothetical protein
MLVLAIEFSRSKGAQKRSRTTEQRRTDQLDRVPVEAEACETGSLEEVE